MGHIIFFLYFVCAHFSMSYARGLQNMDQTITWLFFVSLSSYISFVSIRLYYVFHQMEWMVTNKCMTIAWIEIEWTASILLAHKQKHRGSSSNVLSELPFRIRKHLTRWKKTTNNNNNKQSNPSTTQHISIIFKLCGKCAYVSTPHRNEVKHKRVKCESV